MNSSKPPPLSSSEAKQALGAAASGGGAEETERLVPEEASRPPTPRDEFGIRISEFAQFAQKNGYLKARQLKKQFAVKENAETTARHEKRSNNIRKGMRLKEMIRVSDTSGAPSDETPIDKILATSIGAVRLMEQAKQLQQASLFEPSSKSLIEDAMSVLHESSDLHKTLPPLLGAAQAATVSMVDNGINSYNESVPPVSNSGSLLSIDDIDDEADETIRQQLIQELDLRFFTDVALKQSMLNPTNELLCSMVGLEHFPLGMGDTFFLQTGFIRNISCTINKLQYLISHKMPQLTMRHLRYVNSLNLANNKISKLPTDFGACRALRTLQLSGNNLSNLPSSISRCVSLTSLDVSKNNFKTINDDLANVANLTSLNVSQNLLISIPSAVVKIRKLRHLDLSQNTLFHFGVLPQLLKPENLWIRFMDDDARYKFRNVLTKEVVRHPDAYDGKGIERMKDLHSFQQKWRTRQYAQRKFWLSINQVMEWEPAIDEDTGLSYFRNNISGETTWDVPKDIDTIGQITGLEVLLVNNNVMKAISPAITQLTNLKKLALQKNRFHGLPADFGKLVNLEYLNAGGCELRFLPPSICDCSALTFLDVQQNQIIRLPDMLGTMASLKSLNCAANRLSSIPFTLGFSKTLFELQAQENPLVDPPAEELGKGLESFKWYLRQRLIIDKQGLPPAMDFHYMSIRHEVMVLKPELTERIRYLVDVSKESGALNLQMMGIEEIPNEVLRVKKLKKLKLDYNDHLKLSKGIPPELQILKSFSMKACKFLVCPDNISNLKRCISLNLEENCFEYLPPSFIKLKTLTNLDVSKNKLYMLPTGFESLTVLRTLNLESNNIEELPAGLGRIETLVSLNLRKNRIVDIPDQFCDLTNLKKLNFEMNKLVGVPRRLGCLPCVELRLGHNRIEALPDDLFSAELGASVKMFSVCENNLLNLPSTIYNIDPECLLEADFNPIRSPPQYLLSEGLKVVQHYMHIRTVRLAEFETLITAQDFVIEVENTYPYACEVLSDGTGFLSPEDLNDFDQAVDQFLNEEFFNCPSSAAEIVKAIANLRESRETELYLTILNTTLSVLEKIVKGKDKRFKESVLFNDTRPWGLKGEKVNVWVISLQAILRDTPPNRFVKSGRPALINMINAALPPTPFPFTIDLLKDSLRLYLSPYGQVADTEQVIFPKCDCVDDVKGKAKKHNPCKKPAVVICKSLYTEEEAQRREIEEDEYYTKFEEIEADIDVWLMTEEGLLALSPELKNREANLSDEIDVCEELEMLEQVKVGKATGELAVATRRKAAFEGGEPFDIHGYSSLEECLKDFNSCEAALKKVVEKHRDIEKALEDCMKRKEIPFELKRKMAIDDIKQKYCNEFYAATINKFRQHASQNDFNRYWDGEDGKQYLAWAKKSGKMKSVKSKRAVTNDLNALARDLGAELDEQKGKEKLEKISIGEKYSEFAFDKTDIKSMATYDSYLYARYRAEKSNKFSAMDAAKNIAKFITDKVKGLFGIN